MIDDEVLGSNFDSMRGATNETSQCYVTEGVPSHEVEKYTHEATPPLVPESQENSVNNKVPLKKDILHRVQAKGF